MSSGLVVRGSMTSASTPEEASSSAASRATETMRPMATMVTSPPSRATLASPNGIV